jgi:hypothetical protein
VEDGSSLTGAETTELLLKIVAEFDNQPDMLTQTLTSQTNGVAEFHMEGEIVFIKKDGAAYQVPDAYVPTMEEFLAVRTQ